MEVYLYNKTSLETKILIIEYSQAVMIIRELRKKNPNIQMICDSSLDNAMDSYQELKPFRVVNNYEELIN